MAAVTLNRISICPGVGTVIGAVGALYHTIMLVLAIAKTVFCCLPCYNMYRERAFQATIVAEEAAQKKRDETFAAQGGDLPLPSKTPKHPSNADLADPTPNHKKFVKLLKPSERELTEAQDAERKAKAACDEISAKIDSAVAKDEVLDTEAERLHSILKTASDEVLRILSLMPKTRDEASLKADSTPNIERSTSLAGSPSAFAPIPTGPKTVTPEYSMAEADLSKKTAARAEASRISMAADHAYKDGKDAICGSLSGLFVNVIRAVPVVGGVVLTIYDCFPPMPNDLDN